MKILMVATNFEAPVGGGGQKSLRILVDALRQEGHSVIVAALSHGTVGQVDVDGVPVRYLPVRNIYRPIDTVRAGAASRTVWHVADIYNLASMRDFRRLCEEVQPDIVHSHVISGLSVSIWSAARAARLPVVHTLRDQYLFCPKTTMFKNGGVCSKQCADCAVMRFPHRRISRQVNGVIGCSEYILEKHLTSGFFEGAVSDVIYNARTPAAIGLPLSARSSVSPKSKVRIGYIGALAASKGVEILLEAFRDIDPERAELWLAGTGEAEYVRGLKEAFCQDNIMFLGRVKPRDFYPEVDVVTVPSIWNDTFPGVVFESLAYGRPVIGSLRGGIPEMVQHGVNGLLFDPTSSVELRQSLNQMIFDGARRMEMGVAAVSSSEIFLDTRRFARQHVDFYQRSIAAHLASIE